MRILQSALASVLGIEAAGSEESKVSANMEDNTSVLVVAILLHVPATLCPAGSVLFEGCVHLFKRCLESANSKVCIVVLPESSVAIVVD